MSHPDKIFLCGPLGNGAAAKISNNYLSGPFLLAIAESFAIGIKNGLDKDVLANVIRNSSGMSWMGEHMHPVPGVVAGAPSSNGYKVGFRHELMVKDTTLGIEAAEKNGVEPSMARTAVEMYRRAAGDTRTEVSPHIGGDGSKQELMLSRALMLRLFTSWSSERNSNDLCMPLLTSLCSSRRRQVTANSQGLPSLTGWRQVLLRVRYHDDGVFVVRPASHVPKLHLSGRCRTIRDASRGTYWLDVGVPLTSTRPPSIADVFS